MTEAPRAAVIEIVERTNDPDPVVIVPSEIRINGLPVLTPRNKPVVVHEISVDGTDAVQVTLTLFARRVVITDEPLTAAGDDSTPAPDRSGPEGGAM